MMKSKISRNTIALVIIISIVACTGIYINHINSSKKTTLTIHKLYIAEAKEPKWLSSNSDLIVIGSIINKSDPTIDNTGKKQTIYTDYNIKVENIIKSNEKVNIGDVITLRNIGGETKELRVDTDTTSILQDNTKMIFCLSDITKDKSIPYTNNNMCYFLTGGPNGTFNITSDDKAVRSIVNDSKNVDDLVAEFKGLSQ